MAQTVLVMGASGLFGGQAAKAFATAGWTVRKYQRGTDLLAAANGADVIVNAMNPPNYHDWDNIIPQITRDGIEAALSSGATLLIPGSVYPYGDQPGPWGPNTPHRPAVRKGRIRAEAEVVYRAATAKGLKLIILRGGDFIDPQSARSMWNMIVLKSVAKGKITTTSAPGVRRAYAYLPDMARAAVALAESRATLPAFADVPFAGFTLSVEQVAAEIAQITGKPQSVGRFPWWAMRLASPFYEMARELVEMRYLHDTSHSLDPAPMAALLPDFRMTPLVEVLRQELAVLAPPVQGRFSTAQTGQ